MRTTGLAVTLGLLASAVPALAGAPTPRGAGPAAGAQPVRRSYQVQAGDFDGDGVADIADVQVVHAFNWGGSSSPQRQYVVARRARDGASIWERTLRTGTGVFPMFTKVGPQGRAGMLVTTYDTDLEPYVTLDAYDHTGEPLWTRSLVNDRLDDPRSDWSESAFRVAGTDVAATGDLVRGGGTDVLLVTAAAAPDMRSNPHTGVDHFAPQAVRLSVVDGADGTVRDLGDPFVSESAVTAAVAGDLDGDRAGDVLVMTTEQGLPVLRAMSSADGEVLWTAKGLGEDDDFMPFALPDVTGDGVPDAAARVSYDIAGNIDNDATFTLVSGADGRKVWTRPGSGVVALGDIDRRRGSEVALFNAAGGTPYGAAAYGVSGKAIWTASGSWGGGHGDVVTYHAIGDTQGDGVPEIAHRSSDPYDWDLWPDAWEGVVDGRTGRVLPVDSRVLRVVDGAVDGRGTDVVTVSAAKDRLTVTALRGDSATPLWRTVLPAGGYGPGAGAVFTVKADKDRCADVVVTYGIVGGNRTLALSGATGSPIWSVDRTDDVEDVVAPPRPLSRTRYARTC